MGSGIVLKPYVINGTISNAIFNDRIASYLKNACTISNVFLWITRFTTFVSGLHIIKLGISGMTLLINPRDSSCTLIRI